MGIILSIVFIYQPIFSEKNLTMAKKAAPKKETQKKETPKERNSEEGRSKKSKVSPKKDKVKKTESSPKKETPSAFTKKFKLSADLAAIIGKKEASRPEITKDLWAYLKKNNLQDQENKQFFTPDKKMAKIFGKDKLKAFTMSKFINAHLIASA